MTYMLWLCSDSLANDFRYRHYLKKKSNLILTPKIVGFGSYFQYSTEYSTSLEVAKHIASILFVALHKKMCYV